MNADEYKNALDIMFFLLETLPKGRAKSIALTKLDEMDMWIAKAILDEHLKQNNTVSE